MTFVWGYEVGNENIVGNNFESLNKGRRQKRPRPSSGRRRGKEERRKGGKEEKGLADHQRFVQPFKSSFSFSFFEGFC